MIQSETEKFFEEVARAALGRLGIPLEDAGYYTEAQERLVTFIAEGYHLWRIKVSQSRGKWYYTFLFGKGKVGGRRRVKLTGDEMQGLKDRHVHMFTECGMAAIDEDCQYSIEMGIEYEESKHN